MSKVLASERMDRKEMKEEYEKKVCKRRTEARLTVEERGSVSEVFIRIGEKKDFEVVWSY